LKEERTHATKKVFGFDDGKRKKNILAEYSPVGGR
jgi:hypothetical protein